ncbi:hypothetical protein [Brevibacillus porteri]
MSFAEINELRIMDLVDFTYLFFDKQNGEPREATQADIDAFFGR